VALLQLSPPDVHGYCTLVTSVDAALAAALSARYIVAEIDEQMPRTIGNTLVPLTTACLRRVAARVPRGLQGRTAALRDMILLPASTVARGTGVAASFDVSNVSDLPWMQSTAPRRKQSTGTVTSLHSMRNRWGNTSSSRRAVACLTPSRIETIYGAGAVMSS
jgi:hypothetical protein